MRSVPFLATLAATSLALAGSPPKVTHNCSKVHIAPRPCKAAVQVTRHTTLYFEVTVPTSSPATERVDPDTVSATLTRSGGSPVPMFGPGRVWAPGFTGRTIDVHEAHAMGLITRIVEPGEHVAAALALAEEIARHPRETTNSDRTALLAARGLDHEAELGRAGLATAHEGARRFAQRK